MACVMNTCYKDVFAGLASNATPYVILCKKNDINLENKISGADW